MRTKTIKREASVSRTQALKELFARYPNADLVSFTKKADKFEAILRMAGEPPFGGEKKESPAEDAAEDSAEDSADDSAEDSADDSGGPPPMDGGPDDGGDEGMEKKLSPEEETVHLLREILHAVQGGGMGGPPPGGPMDAMAEVGAPPQHGGLPGGHPGAGGPPPLPPPAKPMGGPGAFASTKRSFVAELDGGNGLTYKQAVASAEGKFTGYRVAKMERNEERDLIRVAMVKQA